MLYISKNILLGSWIIFSIHNDVYCQQNTSLSQVLADAKVSSPLSTNTALMQQQNILQQKNIASTNHPQLALHGQATYQSETTGLNVDFPGLSIPRLSKDQYRLQLDATQYIYDGGINRVMRDISNVNFEINSDQLDMELEQLQEQVIKLYFVILELTERSELLELKRKNILTTMERLQTAVNSGTVLASELKVLKAELLTIDQMKDELYFTKLSQITIINQLTQSMYDMTTTFERPQLLEGFSSSIEGRPVFQILKHQTQQSDLALKSHMAGNSPKILLFAQAGYGKPGLNFLTNGFDTYYLGGIKLQWNLSHMYNNTRTTAINTLQKQQIASQHKNIELQISSILTGLESEIQRTSAQMAKDDEIILYRQDIKNVAIQQLELGVITSADYVFKVNDEMTAVVNKKLHEIQKLKATYLYAHHSGSL
ncbi:MAG: TolC family protein [Saprospiraceae bacterium]